MANSPAKLDLTQFYQTADEIAEGKWIAVQDGFEVLIARAGGPEFERWAAVANKKFARRGTREIPADKMGDSARFVMARACFKGFRGPGEVTLNGEVIENNAQGRETLLRELPDFANQIAELAGSSAEEFAAEVESAGKD